MQNQKSSAKINEFFELLKKRIKKPSVHARTNMRSGRNNGTDYTSAPAWRRMLRKYKMAEVAVRHPIP